MVSDSDSTLEHYNFMSVRWLLLINVIVFIAQGIVVNTPNGSIQGALENNFYVFKGIPFAEPPLANLRW